MTIAEIWNWLINTNIFIVIPVVIGVIIGLLYIFVLLLNYIADETFREPVNNILLFVMGTVVCYFLFTAVRDKWERQPPKFSETSYTDI